MKYTYTYVLHHVRQNKIVLQHVTTLTVSTAQKFTKKTWIQTLRESTAS